MKLLQALLALLFPVIGVLAIIGWFLNLFAIWGLPVNGELVLRVIGILVFPLGCILGWL